MVPTREELDRAFDARFPQAFHQAVSSALFGDYSIVCEAFDRPEEKAMLVNTLLRQCPNTVVVWATAWRAMGTPTKSEPGGSCPGSTSAGTVPPMWGTSSLKSTTIAALRGCTTTWRRTACSPS
ncbi:MAG: hypothetical protein LUD84_08455 [Clostridiales bacterium]|nr:hypothetical protein [Clostridiales bacterium]